MRSCFVSLLVMLFVVDRVAAQVHSCTGRCGVRTLFAPETRASLVQSQTWPPALKPCQCDDACTIVGDCCVDLTVVCMQGAVALPPAALYEYPADGAMVSPISIAQTPAVSPNNAVMGSDTISGAEVVTGPSCRGSCGHATPSTQGKSSVTCYCDSSCVLHQDCCGDYQIECFAVMDAWLLDTGPTASKGASNNKGAGIGTTTGASIGLNAGISSCVDRCDDAYDGLHQCYCDAGCVSNMDCCPDYGACT
jgi:hypothetical protein